MDTILMKLINLYKNHRMGGGGGYCPALDLSAF